MSKYKRLKKRVYEVIRPASSKSEKLSIFIDLSLCILVILSCIAVIIELFGGIPDALREGLETFEYVTVGIFIAEYLIRLWVSELEYPECPHKVSAMWEYITSFDSLIDILSIVSILFNQIPKEFAVLRLIKLVKLVRLVKMSDYIKTTGKFKARTDKMKKRIIEIIDKGEDGDIASKIYDITTVILIVLSVSFILLETFPIPDGVHNALFIFEVVIACIFTVEYILRVWTAPLVYPELRPDKARMRYIFSFMSLVDLLSIIPIFVADLSTATGILKVFKLCKILRLLKVSRYLSSIANFGHAIQRKKKQILMSIIAMVAIMMICSVLMYSFENKEQPEVFSNGFSGIYYSFQTMIDADSEIGPVTPIGQALSTMMLLLGGCIIGVPIAIIATGFEDMIAEQAGDNEEAQEENEDSEGSEADGEADSTQIYDALRLYDGLSAHDKIRFNKIIKLEDENEE